MLHRSKVTDKEQCLFRLTGFAQEGYDIVCTPGAVDPLKTVRMEILLA